MLRRVTPPRSGLRRVTRRRMRPERPGVVAAGLLLALVAAPGPPWRQLAGCRRPGRRSPRAPGSAGRVDAEGYDRLQAMVNQQRPDPIELDVSQAAMTKSTYWAPAGSQRHRHTVTAETDLDEACALGLQAASLARSFRSARMPLYIRDIRHRLHDRYGDRMEVAQFSERAAELLGATEWH